MFEVGLGFTVGTFRLGCFVLFATGPDDSDRKPLLT